MAKDETLPIDRTSRAVAKIESPVTAMVPIDTDTAGKLLEGCRIDLPPDDVVEEIEFERFFLLNLFFRSLQGDDTTKPAPISVSKAKSKTPPTPDMIDVGSLPIALYMPFTQQWKLDGYNRGRVVNSFTLAPGEEQTVEVFTWDRMRTAFESTTSFDSEETKESSGSRRDVLDVSSDVSHQTGLEMTTGGKVGFTVGVVNVDLTGGTGAKTGVNEAEKSTRNSIVEATTRSTSHVRTSRTLKVSESRESGREERVTRKLRNPNVCHTLTVPFFEILANYRVATFVRAEEVRLVALIDTAALSKMSAFDRKAVRAHETSLRLALLDREMEPGFAAARELDARDRACAVLCEGCACEEDQLFETDSKEWEAVVTAARAIAKAVEALRTRTVVFPASVFLAVPAAVGGGGVSPPVITYAITDIKRYLFNEALDDGAPRLVMDLAAVGIGTGATAAVSAAQARAIHGVLSGLAPTSLAILRSDPGLADRVGWEIYGAVLLFHPELISGGAIAGGVRAAAGGLTSYDDEGLVNAISAFGPAYDEWLKKQAEAEKDAETRAALAKIAKEERDLRILESFGLRETADAQERLDALIDHLNDPRNIGHYQFAVWNERSGATDDKVIALALAGLIDPTPVGIVGDRLAVPIRLEREARWSKFFTDSISDLVEHTVKDERRHILPTAALYTEAIVGDCCACEDEIVRKQALELDGAQLRNELLQLEKDRLKARLVAIPPLLDKDCCPVPEDCDDRDHHHRHPHHDDHDDHANHADTDAHADDHGHGNDEDKAEDVEKDKDKDKDKGDKTPKPTPTSGPTT